MRNWTSNRTATAITFAVAPLLALAACVPADPSPTTAESPATKAPTTSTPPTAPPPTAPDVPELIPAGSLPPPVSAAEPTVQVFWHPLNGGDWRSTDFDERPNHVVGFGVSHNIEDPDAVLFVYTNFDEHHGGWQRWDPDNLDEIQQEAHRLGVNDVIGTVWGEAWVSAAVGLGCPEDTQLPGECVTRFNANVLRLDRASATKSWDDGDLAEQFDTNTVSLTARRTDLLCYLDPAPCAAFPIESGDELAPGFYTIELEIAGTAGKVFDFQYGRDGYYMFSDFADGNFSASRLVQITGPEVVVFDLVHAIGCPSATVHFSDCAEWQDLAPISLKAANG